MTPAAQCDLAGAVVRGTALDGLSVSVRRYRRGSSLGWHDHERASFSVVLAGAYLEALPYRDRDCSAGSVVLHPPGERHRDVHGSSDVRILNVSLAYVRGPEERPLGALLTEPREIRSEILRMMARRLSTAVGRAGPSSALLVEGLALEMLGVIVGNGERAGGAAPAWLPRLVDRILADPAADHRLGDLAVEAGVHPVHLARTFRTHQRCTIGEFVRNARVAWARERLATDLPLAEIALLAGFTDQSHFSRVFSRLVGVPPGRYRSSLARDRGG